MVHVVQLSVGSEMNPGIIVFVFVKRREKKKEGKEGEVLELSLKQMFLKGSQSVFTREKVEE